MVYYSIKSINTDATVFEMDEVSGELTMVQPARSDLVQNGQFSIVVRATDAGKDPHSLHTDVQVIVNVGSDSNDKPVFQNGSGDDGGIVVYEADVMEDAPESTRVVRVAATDPEGTKVTYSLHSGAKDNFVIDPKTGWISVSPNSPVLDIEENGDRYEVIVRAEDAGEPFHQFADAKGKVYSFKTYSAGSFFCVRVGKTLRR